MKAALDIIL